MYNTARAEVALAWLTAVVLPEKEHEDRMGHSKGKASAEGGSRRYGFNGAFSTPSAAENEVDADEEEDA